MSLDEFSIIKIRTGRRSLLILPIFPLVFANLHSCFEKTSPFSFYFKFSPVSLILLFISESIQLILTKKVKTRFFFSETKTKVRRKAFSEIQDVLCHFFYL